MSQVKSGQSLDQKIEYLFSTKSVTFVTSHAIKLLDDEIDEVKSYINLRDLISYDELEGLSVDLMIKADARRKLWQFVALVASNNAQADISWSEFLINLNKAVDQRVLEIGLSGATALEGSRGVGARLLKSYLKDFSDEVMDLFFDEQLESKKAERN